jgi:hypothetical protein
MRGLLVVLSVLLGVFHAPQASAAIHGISQAQPSTCPNGTADPLDGCRTANPNATIAYPANFFNGYANQSGQSYFSTNPSGDAAVVGTPWNLPCMTAPLGYACGPYTPRANALDPATNHPSQCGLSYPTTHAADIELLTCSGAMGNTLWQNLDFGPLNGHGATFVHFNNSVTGTNTFDDVWFTEDDGCHMTGTTVWMDYANGTAANVVLQNFAYDGNDPVCRYLYMGGVEFLTTGSVVIQNGLFKHPEARAMTLNSPSNTIRWLLVDGWNFNASAHGEILTIGPGTVNINHSVSFNSPGGQACASTSSWYLSNGLNNTWPSLSYNNMVAISNTCSGTTNPPNPTVGYSLSVDTSDPSGCPGSTHCGNLATITSNAAGVKLAIGQLFNSTAYLSPSTGSVITGCPGACSLAIGTLTGTQTSMTQGNYVGVGVTLSGAGIGSCSVASGSGSTWALTGSGCANVGPEAISFSIGLSGYLLDQNGNTSYAGCTGAACIGVTFHLQCFAPVASYCSGDAITMPLGSGQVTPQVVTLQVPNLIAGTGLTTTLFDNVALDAGAQLGHTGLNGPASMSSDLIDKTGTQFFMEGNAGWTNAISNVSNANPGVVTTSAANGLVTGQSNVFLSSVGGMTGVNGGPYTITVISPTTFSFGVDTTASGSYTSGGTMTASCAQAIAANNNHDLVSQGTATLSNKATGC